MDGERERVLKTNKKSRLSHSDLGSAACQPSAEAGAGPAVERHERARVDEFGAVGRPCGESSELAIAVPVLSGWMDGDSLCWGLVPPLFLRA